MFKTDLPWIRARRSANLEQPRIRPPSLTTTYSILFLLFLTGIVLTLIEHQIPNQDAKRVSEHLASALIVAAVIGFSYERLLHRLREAQFERLFIEHREKTFEAFAGFLTLTSSKVFVLLEDIAEQSYKNNRTFPTLYQPPRLDRMEYGFTESLSYFDTLLKVDRDEIISVLARWVHPNSAPSLKFLGSDFIGKYQLDELAGTIHDQSARKLKKWDTLSEEEKGWVLNFAWAASRCEEMMYSRLARLIRTTEESDIREWILFIPLQMQDPEFLQVIASFLERQDQPTDKEMRLVVTGLAELYGTLPSEVEALLKTHSAWFNRGVVLEEIRRAWSSYLFLPDRVIGIVQQ